MIRAPSGKCGVAHSALGMRERGIALAIVVWFIAGMSLLVAGIVSHARVDTQMAQLHVARAKAAAAGDGAIQLIMADLVTGALMQGGGGGLSGSYRQGQLTVEVSLVPATGLIDINSVSGKLLAGLFVVAGGIERTAAITVASNVVKWRSSGQGRAKHRRFSAVEDLLRIDGVSRRMLDSVRDYVVVGLPSQRGSNWSLSPETVLNVLRESDPQKGESLLQKRRETAEVNPGDGSRGSQLPSRGLIRADAVVRYGDQLWLRRRWLNLQSGVGSSLPWQAHRTEAPRVVGRKN